MARGEVNPIQVWRFHQAPAAYQKLSEHGGDEDWLAFVPDVYDGLWMPWLEKIGVCEVSEHRVAGGTVRIGAHA